MTPEVSPLKVGIVGLGYWGPNLLRVLVDSPDAEVRRICELDEERLARFARRYPAVTAGTRYEDLLEDPELDAIIVATPVDTHFALAGAALRAGKHTFVEKPMSASADEAEELARLAADCRLALMCGHTFLYSPPVRMVKSMVDSGDLGEIYFVTSTRVNLGLHQRDVSVIWDLGPHDFSILLYCLGEVPDRVRAVGRDSVVPGIPDIAFVTLRFPSGLLANIELSWLAPSKLRRTVLVGSERMLIYDDTSSEQVRLFNHGVVYADPETFGEYQLSYRTGDIISPRIDTAEPLAVEIAQFIDAARAGRAPEGHLDLAKNVVRLAEAADLSLVRGGDEIALGIAR